ncbi:MAG: DUF4430 domain-containing protein [Methanomassiliicoccales archaeon]
MSRVIRVLLLIILVVAVSVASISVYVVYYSNNAKGQVVATLIVDFGERPANFGSFNVTVWQKTTGHWAYSLRPSNITEFEFENVTSAGNNVWSLMLSSSQIMKSTTGLPLSISYTYYAEYNDYYVTAIGGVSNGNGLYWQYDVNGAIAAFGVLQQHISDGQTVKWFFGPA